MIKKTTIAAVALLAFAFSAVAEMVSQETALAVAEGFIKPGGFGARLLPDRSVSSATAWGNLWIVALEPSGYIEIAGSTKCAPILSFSSQDFAEPEVGSPLVAKLSADNRMVENKEADESLADNAGWAKYTAPAAKKRTLLAAKPTGTDGTGYDPYVAPLLGATWNQTAPFNDLSPYNYFCGCMATAAGQELRYWRWPYRYEKVRQSTHGVRDAQFNYSDFVIRPNGLVPFNWDKVVASAPNPASTPWAADKEATYNTAWLSFWVQSLTGMGYKPGGSGGTKQLASTAEEYWYEKGTGYTYWKDGYEALWVAVKSDLDWGSPIQINTAAHQMVIDGYAVENYGEADEVDWINLNLGYGNAVYWDNLKTAVTEGTYSGTLASFQTGFRPQKIVQFEPVPKVSGTSLTLAWHLPPCYTNRISGFLFQTLKDGNNAGAGMISSLGDTTERYTYEVTGLETGCEYTFTVTPLMNEGEGTGRANSVTTTIGVPKAAPEIISVSSVACGIELLQQDIFIECAYGSVNKIDLTCSESTTEVVPYSSHLTILPDNKLSVTKVGNVFTVNVDATAMDPKWSGEMLVLTLVAKNGDGTEAYKNLMLRFNSMRQVINGTFDAAEGDGNSPVWFCGDTTIDAKGRAVSFGANAFQGTGKVTLIDSVGTGSFTFAGLDNFKGTLVFAGDVGVTLPSDMSGFAGALSITSGTYAISNNLPATATVTVDEGVNVNLVNANVASTITGTGSINITSGSSVLSGTVTSSVKLYGGELTIPAGTGDYSTVSVGGGTLKIQLSRAQSILGYDWWLPLYTSGAVKFVLYDGTEVDATTTAATPGIKIAHESDVNVWTGENYALFGDKYSAKWSKGLPGEGDYVIFNSALDDTDGTMMRLDLSAERNLGYVLVKGASKLEIGKYNTDTSALLTADVLENEVETHITTTFFQPKAVIPRKKLSTSSGFVLSCELDSAYADNLKKHETGGSALPDANYWQGTVVFCNKSVNNLELPNYGNAQSKIRLNGVTGSLMGNKAFEGVLELIDYDGAPAFDLNSGSSSYPVIIGSLVSNGTFKTSGSATALNILLKDISSWTGSFDLASKTVAIGQSVPSSYTGTDGRLHICQAATVADGATWKAAGGLYLGEGGALTVNGVVEAKNVTTYGTGASVALEDGAVLQVSAASVNDSAPTLNFKSGTFRVKEGSDAFRETATINFCAASGAHTAVDANGSILTLGPNVFSGSGDVYLTSSKAGGKIVVEGISADYTGTIYCDISCEVSFGDLSKATNCNINVSDVILSRSSSDVGNLTVGLGASLEVTVTKDNQINGCIIDTVTLNDGATMVLKDKTGQVLETFTAEDAVDGKYVLAADPSVTVEYLLDYEFNGNMNSVGTDTTGLNIWNGTASYDSKSEKIYMRCKPYINKTFAMPDDEWSVFMRCTLPTANSEKPTMMLMFGKNGGNVFGLVAGTGENTVALASKDNLIGEAVQISDATTKQHVYAIVKTANRVRLYVDGVLKVDESATVSVSKEFQFGSVKNGNNTSYDPCDDANALIDYMRFYDFAVGQSIIDEETVLDDDPEYTGPEPVAVWVAGEFGDDRSAHSGLEISLNGNTTNALGQIVIGSSSTLGATIALPAATHQKMTMLVEYSIPSGGAPAANSVPASMFSTYDLGARAAQAASSALDGYWLNGSSVAGGYDFSTPAQTMPQEGYILISTWATDANPNDHGTAVYSGETLSTLSGGEKTGLRFTGPERYIASVGIGGPTVAGAVPWSGMVIKSVAIFDEWVTPSDLANYTFPAQGAVRPVDSDRYTIEPVVSWVNDFKTNTKGDYTLSVSGTTAVKDDTFGGTLTIGDAAAVVDVRNGANGGNLTVLVKYRATPATVNAPVVTFGETLSNSVKIDVGAYTQSARTLAVNRSWNGGNNKWVSLNTAASLNEGEGYLLCARKSNDMMVYVGDSLDNMAGGSTAAPGDITFTCDLIQAIGIGGPSGLPNDDSTWSPFTGFVVEKVVVFNGYYTPADLTSFNVKAGETKSFTAGETEEYPTIGTLSSSGTIKIANAATLSEGAYKLAEWATPQIMSSGYGRVGTLTTDGLPNGLTAELVYGVKAIYLRVYDAAAYAARPKLKIMPYGDSITEGFNLGDSKANYRVLLGQKLAMLGYNVEMVGCYNKIQSRYGTDTFFDAIDPSGAVATNIWQWHSAKHGATLGVTALTSWQRSALTENVDTISAMAGKPDVVLLLGGINDLSPGYDAPATVFGNWTNVVSRLVKDLPDTKIVVTTTLHAGPGRTDSLNTNADNFNVLVKGCINDMPAAWSGHVYFVDLCDAVKSAETGVISSDNLHPDWLGDDQMAEGWLSVITNLYPSANGVFPSSTPLPSVSDSELGAAAKSELDDYRNGYKLCRTITPTGNIDTSNPYSSIGDGVTNYIEKVAYFVEYVRADNNAHKWVWVDMDAFGDCDLASVGLPAANRQQVVTKLHVKSNHNGIDDVAANDDTVSGWIEFSPYDYTGNSSGVDGAPLRHGAATGNFTMFDWDDTLLSSGSMGSMQVFRKATPSGRSAQVLFAYNNWRSSTSEAEFGIGNFAQHFWGGAQTLDYTYTKGLAKMNASVYSVKRIEIWTKAAVGEKATTTTGFPVPYSWIEACFPGIEGQPDAMYETMAKSPGDNGYAYWESYVLGLEPTNETSKFMATIRMDGTTPVVGYSPTNEVLKASGAIEYILQGKPALSNDWQNVEFDAPGDTNRFFRVKVTW